MSKQMEYREQLEAMNEDGLRHECLRLKNELYRIVVRQLTEPIDPPKMSEVELDKLIYDNQQRFSEICQKDMSEPTQAEINSVRELRMLIRSKGIYYA